MTTEALKIRTSIDEDLNNLSEESLIEIAEFVRKKVLREYVKNHGVRDLPMSPDLQWLRSSGSVNISDEDFNELRFQYLNEKYK